MVAFHTKAHQVTSLSRFFYPVTTDNIPLAGVGKINGELEKETDGRCSRNTKLRTVEGDESTE